MLNEKYAGLLIPSHRIIDADTKQTASDNMFGWELQSLTAEGWLKQLEAGHTIQPSVFKPKTDGKFTHSKRNWISSNFICADADNLTGEKDATDTALEKWQEADGLINRFPKLKDDAYAIGQSVSSMSTDKNPPHRRHRIVFLFDEPITTREHYEYILATLAKKYPIIPNVDKSPAQPVFGNARPGYGFDIIGNILQLDKYQLPIEHKKKQEKPAKLQNSNMKTDETLQQFLDRHSIEYTPDKEKSDKFFITCPFSTEHASGINQPKDSYVFSDEKGWAFYCSHDTCKQKGRNNWNSFKTGMGIQSKQPTPEKSRTQTHEQVLKKAKEAFKKEIATMAKPIVEIKDTFSQTWKEQLTIREIEDVFYQHLPQFQFETARDLMERELPEIQWIVPNLLPEGLTILAGDAKIGKSFFCWNLALAVALKGKALSTIDIEKERNVMIFCLEESPKSISMRLHTLLPEQDPPATLNIAYEFAPFMALDTLGLYTLEEHIDNYNTELLIIDTWQHARPQHKNNSGGSAYDIDYQALKPVQEFAHKKGIAVVLVTHTRKAGDVDNPFNQIQGSMGVQACCDTLLMLRKSAIGGNNCILHVSGRQLLQAEYIVELQDGGHWTLLGDADEINASDARLAILQVLKDAGDIGMSVTELCTETEKSKQNIYNLLKVLKDEGKVVQPKPRGKYFHTDFVEMEKTLIDEISL